MDEIDKTTRIENAVNLFIEKENGFETRYNSWVYCHSFFKTLYQNNKSKKYKELTEVDKKLSLLNLAFYLASWGMYRGSSFVLQYDYKIFKNIISIILNEKYDMLWDIDYQRIKNNKKMVVNLLSEISREICNNLKKVHDFSTTKSKILPDKKAESDENKNEAIVSQTLTTKILLGTLCCCPAYDTFFKKSIGGSCNDFYNKNKIDKLLNLIISNEDLFTQLIKDTNEKYPLMKVVDMAYFTMGLEEDFKKLYDKYIVKEEKITDKNLKEIIKCLKMFYCKINDDDKYELRVTFDCDKNKIDNFIKKNGIKVRE